MWKYLVFLLVACLMIVAGVSLMTMAVDAMKRMESDRESDSYLLIQSFDKEPVDIKTERLKGELAGRTVRLSNAIWHFNENDVNKIVKLKDTWRWAESAGGGVSMCAVVECRKPDDTLLYGTLEFNFQGKPDNYVLHEIRNVNAQVVKEYK